MNVFDHKDTGSHLLQ